MSAVATPDARTDAPLARPDYRLQDNLWAPGGSVFLTGTQALVRLLLMQRARDEQAGLNTQGFVSGYRGSPLGMVDQAIWKAGTKFKDAGIRFVPAINEELAATQVLGTQRVESDPERTVDGVFSMWYGKGPGVDRAGDAIKHGNAYGSSPHGGVLVVAGDDHGCVSSSMPHQSDPLFQAFHMPIVAPANVAEYLEFGLYGWALSRYSGNWVGFTALSEVVESGATVDLDAIQQRVNAWHSADAVRVATGHAAPDDGLHYRWPDLPSLRIESRLHDKLAAVRAFARVNSIDRDVIVSPNATVGIVTCGKAHYDLMEVLRRLEITPSMLAAAGVRLYKVGLSFPIETTRVQAFARGLKEILVVEEKAPIVEAQLRDLFYNAPADARPVIVGKRDAQGQPLVSSLGELRPSRLIEIVAHWIARHFPNNQALGDHLQHVRDFTPPELLSNAGDAVKRVPYFCAGCPHNTSTQGARRVARAGRHRLPLHGVVDVARDRRPDPDGRRGRRLGQPLDVHQGAACVPEPGRRHLLALGLPGDPPGGGVEGDPHLQDPVQRCGGDDRRPAGRRRDHGRPRRAPGRERGRQEGRGDQRRHRQVRPPARPVSGRHRVPPARSSSTRCNAGCARSKA